MDAFTIHVVDGITASTTYTNHFNDTVFLLRCSEVKDLDVIVAVCHNYLLFIAFHTSLLTIHPQR